MPDYGPQPPDSERALVLDQLRYEEGLHQRRREEALGVANAGVERLLPPGLQRGLRATRRRQRGRHRLDGAVEPLQRSAQHGLILLRRERARGVDERAAGPEA